MRSVKVSVRLSPQPQLRDLHNLAKAKLIWGLAKPPVRKAPGLADGRTMMLVDLELFPAVFFRLRHQRGGLTAFRHHLQSGRAGLAGTLRR